MDSNRLAAIFKMLKQVLVFASLLKMTTRVENVLGPVHMEVGQPGRWDSPLGGTNFFARSHGKILSWPLGCVLSRNHWRANIRTCKPKAHAQLAIFHPGRYGTVVWCGANLSGPVAGISVALYRDPIERASSPPHMNGTMF